MSNVVFYIAIVWVAVLLGVVVVQLAIARTIGQRILALDLLTLVLIGLLALAAGEDQRSYALDAALALALLGFVATLAASRYYEDREPFS
ncbi:pH regulation protein F [Solirubrobacter sp. CPCC 204708]|uniref:Monovalent cation/H+ antiporter complex subunit F n=1 Tax=Solirubrobacter deserti TaxID=2282478 RepID=A0ABT4RV71_9ACTN|nr:monovalent cation/H+ antiporter complex subunit F [Solirubrobacter deserti]MBE2321036.1 pH regulation protein F [Solirubrobacter deserti]MDA0142489.1 monovalent cation/H+ antiporter complex subunit F [Solirubrobacter deserti]